MSASGGEQAADQDEIHFAPPRHGLIKDFMKMSEIKDLTPVELSAKGRDLRQEVFNLRLQQASAQLEKPGRLRTLRRDIARIETRISQLRNQAA
jgi:large subunit ribosomal protein L29